MRYKLFLLGVLALLRVDGCDKHLLTDYRPLDQAGMWSSNVEELKKLNTSDTEVAQLVKAKQAGLSDDGCVTLVNDAHQLDVISGDAVVLRLVGLSDRAVEMILHRRLKGQRTLGSAQIGRLKNTGLTEKQILERFNEGITDAQADREAAAREAARNHSGIGFQRVHGRR